MPTATNSSAEDARAFNAFAQDAANTGFESDSPDFQSLARTLADGVGVTWTATKSNLMSDLSSRANFRYEHALSHLRSLGESLLRFQVMHLDGQAKTAEAHLLPAAFREVFGLMPVKLALETAAAVIAATTELPPDVQSLIAAHTLVTDHIDDAPAAAAST